MSRLSDLYKALETFRKERISTRDLEKKVSELEEDIIKEEILPALSNDIAPRLEPIKRDLVLVVEYHPGEPISVALSRKAKISEIMDAKTLTPKVSRPVVSEEPAMVAEEHEPTKKVVNKTKGLKVTFPDGTVIWHKQAIQTFTETLRKIGFERIPAVGLTHGGGYNLVSKMQRPLEPGKIWQHEADGWYIYSNISNGTKAEDLKRISDHYHLGLRIEKGKPE